MPKLLLGPRRAAAALLLATLPLAALAQRSVQDSLLRNGDLVGGRAHPARTAAHATAVRPTAADPVLARMLHESVAISTVPAAQLPDLYARFLEATRDQRRQWSPADWADASATLTRLNQRYEAVRQELPLNERLNVRTYQGEFRTLEAARTTKNRLGGS